MVSRRALLGTAAGFTLLPFAGLSANATTLGIQRRAVGDIHITALLDGYFGLDPAMLVGVDADAIPALLEQSFLQVGPVNTAINAYVIEAGDRRILVDGGTGGVFGPTTGKLTEALAAADIDAATIDTVFCTHLHPDHIGALNDGDAPRFAAAELVAHEAEPAFWSDDSNFADAGEEVQGYARAAQAALAAYADRTTLIQDKAEIAPGVTARHLPGHTPGHTGLLLSSNGETLLLWADIVHLGPIQFARPEVTIPFDVDQPAAAATRLALMDEVATDRVMIAGSHVVFPSFGHIERRANGGYAFAPARWPYEL